MKGVNTSIGEEGITLSGGQKARVSLARAIYADKDILILDDILSAVDVHVGEFLIKKTITNYLLRKGKSILMPTHAVKYLQYADDIIVLDKGCVKVVGSYQDIKDNEIFLDTINACKLIENE